MSMNFKPINEVPVVEKLTEGDMLLVNSGGAAKQIAASRVGSGGGFIYINYDGAEMVQAYRDEGLTEQLTYEEGKSILNGAAHVVISMMEMKIVLNPAFFMNVDEGKISQVGFVNFTDDGDNLILGFVLLYSDTAGLD